MDGSGYCCYDAAKMQGHVHEYTLQLFDFESFYSKVMTHFYFKAQKGQKWSLVQNLDSHWWAAAAPASLEGLMNN